MASSVEKIAFDDDYRCGCCLELRKDMVDPRELPCNHVFCLACISGDYRHGSSIECPVCRKKHPDLIIENLPRPVNVNLTPCHVCGLIAEMCCNQCSIYLCKEHAKLHDERYSSTTMFNKHEKTVAVNRTSKVVQKREKQLCEQHTEEEVQRACSTCFKALCTECILTGKCSGDKSHTPEGIQSLCEKLKKELRKIMSDLLVKSTVLSNLEKEANVILADQEKTFGEMKVLVDKVTEEQINEIQEKACKIKSVFDDTSKASADTVKKYCAEVMANKDVSDGLRRDIHSLINLKSDLGVIQDYKKAVEESTDVFKSVDPELTLPYVAINQLAKQRATEVEATAICNKIVLPHSSTSGNKGKELVEPKDITISSSSVFGWVYSLNWLPNKSVACGLYGKIEIRDTSLNVIKNSVVTGCVWTVCQHGTDYLVLVDDKGYKVNLYSSEFAYKKTVISGDFAGFVSHMALKEQKLLLIDNYKNCVKLYTADGAHVLDIDFKPYITHAWGIQFQGDNFFVITDYHGGKVSKFRLQAHSQLFWSCGGLNQPTGIFIDTSGFLYVTSLALKTIYLLTSSGILLKQFSPPQLYDCPRDLCILDGNIVIGSGFGVQLFKIVY